jgi:hypothetical protein
MAPLSRFVLASRTGITGDFHNKIGPSATSLDVRCLVAFGGKADKGRTD